MTSVGLRAHTILIFVDQISTELYPPKNSIITDFHIHPRYFYVNRWRNRDKIAMRIATILFSILFILKRGVTPICGDFFICPIYCWYFVTNLQYTKLFVKDGAYNVNHIMYISKWCNFKIFSQSAINVEYSFFFHFQRKKYIRELDYNF